MDNNTDKKDESKGLGDTIAKITEVTGIKKVAEAFANATGKDCGCAKRQDTLNRLFPYNK
jgi:glycerol dehydrogenase-like iron-containing ADH family enzyme